MKRILIFPVLIITFVSLLHAQSDDSVKSNLLDNSELSVQWFLANRYYDTQDLDRFELKRGYFTIKTNLKDEFSIRYTQDITVDHEGEDIGNVEMRLKYLYLKMKMNDFFLFNDSYFEFGLVHRPWLDYEEHINTYRVQGTMTVERYSLINSADFGITFVGLLGGKLNDSYQEDVNRSYPGKFGSFAVGIYNGGGYHALETNNNKTVETRLSLRPFPESLPGLQFTYSGVYGKANVLNGNPNFLMHLFFLSSESRYHVITCQHFHGRGSFGTDYIDDTGISDSFNGYSVFGEFKIPRTKFALFGRSDHFIANNDVTQEGTTAIGGIAYRFLKNKVLFDYNQRKNNDVTIRIYELALEVKF